MDIDKQKVEKTKTDEKEKKKPRDKGERKGKQRDPQKDEKQRHRNKPEPEYDTRPEPKPVATPAQEPSVKLDPEPVLRHVPMMSPGPQRKRWDKDRIVTDLATEQTDDVINPQPILVERVQEVSDEVRMAESRFN